MMEKVLLKVFAVPYELTRKILVLEQEFRNTN